LAAISIVAIGCSTKHREWTEDVLLDNGTTIVVKRSVTFNETTPVSGGTYVAEETEAVIEFTGALEKLPPWSQPLMALAMYQDNSTNEWVIVGSTTSCDVWRRRGKPKPSYWEFRFRNGVWREEHLSTASIGRKSNLLFENRHLELRHVTTDDKKRLQSDPQIGRKYREIWGDPEMYTCGDGDTNK